MGKQEHITTYEAYLPTLKEDIIKIMTEWEKEAHIDVDKINMDFAKSTTFENELKAHIDKLVEQKITEIFTDRRNKTLLALYNTLEFEGFERNCIGCLMVDKHYGKNN
ncbi:MAG: hypothetical protein ACK5HL_04380 [Bacilli bacterium]